MQSELPARTAIREGLGHRPNARLANDGNEKTGPPGVRVGRRIKEGLTRLFRRNEQASEQTDDHRLVTEVVEGKPEALALLYDRLSGPLYSMCLRMTGEAVEAEDIVEQAFLTLWRRAGHYDPARSSVFSWAVQLTRCQAICHLRSRGRRSRVPALSPDDGARAPSVSACPRGQAVTQLRALSNPDQDKSAEQVQRVLDTMPDEQRQAIELAFFSDLSHHEISARLEQPLGVVKTRLRLGLLKLRDSLQKIR